ncbi:hypothetical protein BJ878DRAFT_411345 [Calycina marina]|uniref:Defect at low temperature protein 1 n=1 Tax=Calycina marina TaxID=1763456 RepID=A0A9P8CL11_9HELO|nr:hypothetical protein BJ878DRAFT_411345 [Calycina marina]
MIAASLGRSAVIAWDSQPRVDPTPPAVVSDADAKESIARPETAVVKKKGLDVFRKQRMILSEEDDHIVVIPPNEPLWGDIAHKGWASPESPDLPNLQYVTVILELPHLIEARAVSVAPLDPDSEPDMLLPNMQAVDLLQRPAQMGFRDYVGHLISIGIIVAPTTASEFLVAYEHARFSTEALSEHEFRHLMKLFADLLRSIQPLSPAILVSLALHQPENESDIDDDNTSSTTPRTRSLLSTKSVISHSSSEGTVRTRGDASQSTPMTKFSDFIVTPGTQGNGIRVMSKSTSTDGFAQNRSPYNGSSVRSSASIESSGQASVVRLRAANEAGDLPYTLSIPGA